MAEVEEENNDNTNNNPSFPVGRVKKIMKLDKDIKKVTSEALFLINLSTELFLQFLTEKSSKVAIEKKRKIIKIDHLRIAVKRHQPTSDFLLDSLPIPSESVNRPSKDGNQSAPVEKPLPVGTRRIDDIFKKSVNETN
ncbi:nuclear factor Y, subunit C13 [Thalictrum thalictroides]|uniref:Nuclear factor Y, subunit C13 n=1 Tax=Thalictrum thalictroides TaxID=46969 RepID=A0A7J6XI30_THATH|nr:nuclear factor Y, subunit C13 [Thalictrum thalictroides]